MTSIAYADTPFLRQEQLQEQKIQHAISASRSTAQLTKPVAFEKAVEVDPSMQDLSSTAFFVREIVVDDNLEEFSFLEDMTASYTNQEITLAEAVKLLAAMNQKLSDKGYVTSRVVIPEQNVASGLFHLKLLAGRMGRVVYAEGCKAVTWRNAFPIHEGDLLNVYLLEQGVEQMRNVASQDVSMQILPANAAGVSDVELTTYAGKQLSGSLSVDNAGLSETGKYQWTLTTGIDRFFHANDQLQFSFSLDNRKAYVLDELYDSKVIKETIHNANMYIREANMYIREANEIDKGLLREAVLDEHGEENIKDVYEGIGKFSEYDAINVNCLEFIKTILSGKSEKVNDFYDFSFYSFFRKG